jgi:hypothetical protein
MLTSVLSRRDGFGDGDRSKPFYLPRIFSYKRICRYDEFLVRSDRPLLRLRSCLRCGGWNCDLPNLKTCQTIEKAFQHHTAGAFHPRSQVSYHQPEPEQPTSGQTDLDGAGVAPPPVSHG